MGTKERFLVGNNEVKGGIEVEENKSVKRFLRTLFRGYWKRQVVTSILVIIESGGGILIPLVFKQIIDKAIPSGDYKILLNYILGLMGLLLLATIFSYLGEVWFEFTAIKVKKDLQREIINKFMRVPFKYFMTNKVGEQVSKLISDIEQVGILASQFFPIMFLALTQIFGILAIMFFLNWKLALLPIILMVISWFGIMIVNVKAEKLSQKERKKFGVLSDVILNILENIKILKIIHPLNWINKHFEKFQEDYIQTKKTFTRVIKLAAVLGNTIFGIIALALFWYGGYQILNGKMTLGVLIAFWAYMQALANPIQLLMQANVTYRSSYGSISRIKEILEYEEEIMEKEEIADMKIRKLELKNIKFKYKEKEILKGINMKLEEGKSYALVGKSGVGKTTTLNILTGLYRSSSGNIIVNDKDWTEKLTILRKKIGFVEQSPVFFKYCTIKENILMGRDIPDEEFEKIISETGVSRFVENFPQKIDTLLGEVNISGGQKQLLALARALVGTPDVLVLDEFTANVDSKTEEEIHKILHNEREKGKIILFVAHRLSTIQNSDKVFLLDDGKIEAEGPHDELINTSEKYRKLISLQMIS